MYSSFLAGILLLKSSMNLSTFDSLIKYSVQVYYLSPFLFATMKTIYCLTSFYILLRSRNSFKYLILCFLFAQIQNYSYLFVDKPVFFSPLNLFTIQSCMGPASGYDHSHVSYFHLCLKIQDFHSLKSINMS